MRAFNLAVTGLAIGVAACGSYGTSTIEVQRASVAAVAITLPSRSLVAGQTQRAYAAVKDANGVALTNRPVLWYTSSASVATVNDSGVIAGISPGTATVSAVSEGVAGQAAMTVIAPPPAPVAKVLVAITPAAVVVGQVARATAVLQDSAGNSLSGRTVTWQSDNTSVAAVSGNGDISAVAPGVASITAASEGKTASASLTVSAPAPIPVATVSVSPASSSLQIGATVQLSATTRDANNNVLTGRVVAWSSANAGIGSVNSNGLVSAVSAGTTQITASSEGRSSSATITVTAPAPVPVATVSVSPASSSLQIGATVQLSATTRDANNNVLTGRQIAWNSSNTAISSVSASGLVTAVASGSATISALSEGQVGSAAITVTAPPPPPSLPSTVTNLQVPAIDSTSVSLSFTQVNDGAGQPAKYDVRYAVAPITWGSATTATTGTCATPVAGTAIGSQLTCTVLGLTPGTNYNFQLIAFRGTLNVNAVFGSVSNIASATTTGSAVPPPPPPGGTPVWRGNEPAGMTSINERSFNALNEDPRWENLSSPDATIVTDATAPRSPSNTVHFNYPAGFLGGDSPENTEISVGSYRVFYFCYWIKHSSNWQGHITGISKHGYVWMGNSPLFVFEADGAGSGPLRTRMALQGVVAQPNSNGWYTQNLDPNATFTRGQWDYVEILLTGNTSGTANGVMDVYLNGVHVSNWTGIQYSSGTTQWNLFRIYPVWGGIGDVVNGDQYLAWDHVYMSGKN